MASYSAADIRIQLVLNAADAINRASEFTKLIEQLKVEVADVAKKSGSSFAVAAQSLSAMHKGTQDVFATMQKYTISQKDAEALLKNQQQLYTQAANVAASQLQKTKGNVGILSNAFANLGNVIRNAFSFFLGGSIFVFITRLINGFQSLIQTGEEYAQTLYRLGVSINQLQRRGLDITVKSEIELIKELQAEYETFSTKSVISAVASVQMLTRNFGFSQEQIKKTTELSMDLALVQGKDVAETAKQLALFYSSGYGEGLQHAGLAVNRMTVAQEAHRMGLQKSYMQLTEVERATAAYNLVTRQTIDLHKDALKIQDSLIGQIKTQRSAIENVTNEIALRAIPVELAWLKIKRASIEAIADWLEWDQKYKEALAEEGKKYTPFLSQPLWNKSAAAKANEEMKKQKEEWEKILSGTLDVQTDLNLDIGGESDAEQQLADKRQALSDKIREMYDDLLQSQEDYAKDSAELEREHVKTLEQIDEDFFDKNAQLWEDYQDDLLNIARDLDKAIADAAIERNQAIVDAQDKFAQGNIDRDRKYQEQIQDENRKAQEDEYKAERDHQERMKRLKEDYLFALQDALRARDALQVLQLARKYAQDKRREQEDYETSRSDAAREHKLRLQDLARQHAREEAEARESLEREIADAKAAEQKKIEDAKAAAEQKRIDALNAYETAKADALEAYEEEKAAEAEKLAERQEALAEDLEERQRKILEEFGKETAITGDSLDDVSRLFRRYLGANGVVDSVVNQYLAIINNAAEQTDANIQRMMQSLSQLQGIANGVNGAVPGTNPVTGYNYGYGGESYHASGASLIATRPKTFVAGEVPERIDITPLSLYNSDKLTAYSNKGGGEANINVWLSPGLEAEIADNTLKATARIMKSEFNKRRH